MALCMLINYGSAKLMPILILSTTTAGACDRCADNEHIRLEEDITLAGFTPLFCNNNEIYCHRDVDKEIAQVSFVVWSS